MLTGDSQYVDSFEEAYYNPFLAGTFADGKWGARGVRSSGRHMVATGQAGMKHSHCCVNNLPRGFLNALDMIACESKRGLSVNLYSECEGEVGKYGLKISGGYLENGELTVKINSPEPSEATFRLPGWCERCEINGTDFRGHITLPLNPGENTFNLKFEMKPQTKVFPGNAEHFPKSDFRTGRFINGNPVREEDMVTDRRATVRYGALLLCRSKLAGNSEEEMFDEETIVGRKRINSIEPINPGEVRNRFRVKFDDGSETTMCDFATGSNRWSENDDRLFTIWM